MTSYRRLRENERTSTKAIALYMYSWNSFALPFAAALRSFDKIWFSEDVLPVPGCPHRYIRPDLLLRRFSAKKR